MNKRADLNGKNQAPSRMSDPEQLRQLLFPMVVGIAATKDELSAFVHRAGLAALEAILRDDAEAEDSLQEAYMQAYGAMGSFRGDAKLSTWLARIVEIGRASCRERV